MGLNWRWVLEHSTTEMSVSIAQWEFAWPNLDLPNIKARSEVSAY